MSFMLDLAPARRRHASRASPGDGNDNDRRQTPVNASLRS
jgi:hypothetical protein